MRHSEVSADEFLGVWVSDVMEESERCHGEGGRVDDAMNKERHGRVWMDGIMEKRMDDVMERRVTS